MHVAVIPARSGSKGIPNKNLLSLWGHSLIAWAALCARETGLFSEIILTTDSEAYAAEGQRYGCQVPYLRPASLAGDQTAMGDVLLDLLLNAPGGERWETMTLLQPTSPLRSPEQVADCLTLCLKDVTVDNARTVSEVPVHYHARKQQVLDEAGYLHYIDPAATGITYRQQLQPTYVFNGLVFVARCASLKQTGQLLGGCIKGLITDISINLDTSADLQELRDIEASTAPPVWAAKYAVTA